MYPGVFPKLEFPILFVGLWNYSIVLHQFRLAQTRVSLRACAVHQLSCMVIINTGVHLIHRKTLPFETLPPWKRPLPTAFLCGALAGTVRMVGLITWSGRAPIFRTVQEGSRAYVAALRNEGTAHSF